MFCSSCINSEELKVNTNSVIWKDFWFISTWKWFNRKPTEKIFLSNQIITSKVKSIKKFKQTFQLLSLPRRRGHWKLAMGESTTKLEEGKAKTSQILGSLYVYSHGVLQTLGFGQNLGSPFPKTFRLCL